MFALKISINGGCDLMRAGKDTFSAVPQGCDACGEQALAYCNKNNQLAKEKVDLTVNVDGVTEANKDKVCQSVAEKLGGTVEQCNLGASEARLSEERMLAPAELKVRVAVKSAEDAKAKAQSNGFVSTIATDDPNIKVNALSSVTAVAATPAPAGNPQTVVPTTAAQTVVPTTAAQTVVPTTVAQTKTSRSGLKTASADEQFSSFVFTTLALVVMIKYF